MLKVRLILKPIPLFVLSWGLLLNPAQAANLEYSDWDWGRTVNMNVASRLSKILMVRGTCLMSRVILTRMSRIHKP